MTAGLWYHCSNASHTRNANVHEIHWSKHFVSPFEQLKCVSLYQSSFEWSFSIHRLNWIGFYQEAIFKTSALLKLNKQHAKNYCHSNETSQNEISVIEFSQSKILVSILNSKLIQNWILSIFDDAIEFVRWTGQASFVLFSNELKLKLSEIGSVLIGLQLFYLVKRCTKINYFFH